MNIEEISRIAASRLERIRVRNALNPLLWLSVASPIVLLTGAWFFRGDPVIEWLLVLVAALPTVAAVVAYMYLLFTSPDRLQSEEYQLRQTELEMKYKRGRKPDISNTAKEHVRIEGPARRAGDGDSK